MAVRLTNDNESEYNGELHLYDTLKYTMLDSDLQQAIESRRTYSKFKNGFGAGYNPTISVAKESVTDQGGFINYPTGVETIYFTSTSDDDSVAGIGAQLLLIVALDENQNYVEQMIPLNGQAGTAVDLYRIMRIYVILNGTSGSTSGTIYAGNGVITAGVPANIYQTVENGQNSSQACTFSVPKGFTMYLKSFEFETGQGKSVEFSFVFRYPGGDWITIYRAPLYENTKSLETVPLPFIAELADVEIRAINLLAGTVVGSASFWFTLASDILIFEEV